MVAGIATLRVLAENDGYVMTGIESTGRALMAGLRELGRKRKINLYVAGVGGVFNTSFTDQEEVYDYDSFKRAHEAPSKAFLEALLRRGVRLTSRGTWFVSAAHTPEDIEATLAAADAALGEL
jgi:glutamate-1-semialdehyde 2,1-aminomutase